MQPQSLHLFPLPARTWDQAAARWQHEGMHRQRTTRDDDARTLRWLAERWSGLPLLDIDDDRVSDALQARAAGAAGVWTVNRTAETIRAILRAAARWGWLHRVPHIRFLRRPLRRIRFLTILEAQRLLQELPPHLRPVVSFSLETGLRKSNVLGLTWGQVDLAIPAAWIHADQAKARRPIPVPLSPTAVEVLEAERGKHPTWCFTYKGDRLFESNGKAWLKALRRAGIEGFRWHDLRHTWASWHAQHGTPLHVLQELGGWQSAAMVQVYAHLSVKHLQQYVLDFHAARKNPALAGLDD